jgi:ABC-type antimicrobial peptide transport system permease subunit
MRLIYGNSLSVEGADQPTVIVNQALAENLAPGSSALGQYIQIYPFQIQGFPPARIIGIVSNVHETGLYSPPQPTVYYPLSEWAQTNVDMIVRTSRNMAEEDILSAIQTSVHAIVPDATVSNFASLGERVRSAGKLTRYGACYLLALAWLSVLLAGVCAWARSLSEIHRWKQEIGVRMALGGTPGNIVQLVLIRGLKLTALAAVAGALVAWWFSHLLSYLFYDVKLSDPISYLIGVTTVIGFAFIVQTWAINNAVRSNPSDLMRAALEVGDSPTS